MHHLAYQIVSDFVDKYLRKEDELDILDVGSYDVNGCYRPLFAVSEKWKYKGLDMAEGPNVDIVSPEPYNWPINDNCYDVIVSGQCLEHVPAPWLWVKEVERVCKPGGLVIFVAPWSHPVHRYPVDCWRILPDGVSYLFSKWANFHIEEVGIIQGDTICIARKKGMDLVIRELGDKNLDTQGPVLEH